MPVPMRASGASKTGQVVAGSTQTMRVPNRVTRKTSRNTEVQSPARSRQRILSVPKLGRNKPSAQTTKKSTDVALSISRKGFALMRAIPLTLLLAPIATFHIIVGLLFLVSAGVLQLDMLQNVLTRFETISNIGAVLLGGTWFLLVFLGIGMLLTAAGTFFSTGITISSPGAAFVLKICLALSLAPFINIVPWALVYVWFVALTR